MTRVRGFSGPVALTTVLGYPTPIAQPRRGYRFGPENLLLPQLVRGPQEHVIDLGAGCGVLGLLVAHGVGASQLTLVEREPNMAALCRHNASVYLHATGSSSETTGSSSGTTGSSSETTESSSETTGSHAPAIHVAEVDLRSWHPPRASLVIANPPFFAPGNGRMSSEPTTAGATHALYGGVADFVEAAAAALAPSGCLWLLYPADHLVEALSALLSVGLGASKMVIVRARHTGRPYRVWICASAAPDRSLVVSEMTTWTAR